MMNQQRLLRSRSNRMIAGVAAGIANTVGIDPTIVRVVFAGLSLINGIGLVLYAVLWLLMPNEDSASNGQEQLRESIDEMQSTAAQAVDKVRSMFR